MKSVFHLNYVKSLVDGKPIDRFCNVTWNVEAWPISPGIVHSIVKIETKRQDIQQELSRFNILEEYKEEKRKRCFQSKMTSTRLAYES